MRVQDEGTIPVVLDKLDYEANVVGGLTSKELAITFGSFFGVSLPITLLLSYFVLGTVLFGPIATILIAGLGTFRMTKVAYTLKRGRPSYMLWVEMKKRLQHQGVFGIKVQMNFIPSTKWYTGFKKG
ncbi:DUF3487 family protein [Enterovibrio norvegicus]|uniref:DUF3487 family protein n=1 Tax=Enterovibrio norvegicus TaxID=188144 RepID=UPI000C817894|nr:DUF3487 family protein [Enterovibrio norvegicus]PMH64432.1 hypothetical protein BCU62_15370 [Enterovibrio norvegicus]